MHIKCTGVAVSFSLSLTSSFLFLQVTFDKQVMTRSVALAGDVFDPSGTLTGGARPKTSSILSKLQELRECEDHLQEKMAELREVMTQLERMKSVTAK